MAKEVLGGNITFPIYSEDGTPFNDLVLHKATYESVVMSLGDKITGDVYYKDNTLDVSLHEYIVFRNNPNDINDDDVKYILLSPPVVVREGMVADNSDLKGMTKYSFTFYHPMCKLSNMPFTDIAVSNDEKRYKSEDKKFSWIGNLVDFIAKINKNLQETEWVVELSNSVPQDIRRKMSDVMAFDSSTIAEALKTIYETWEVPFIVDSINDGEPHYADGKRFLILVGLPSNEIYEEGESTPFVFKFGKGVGLKNNSANPRNNKIITRIAGRGSENNIPYGYPQIVWEGDQSWDFTIDNNGNNPLSYPIYEGIVGGELVKLIKHPFTRPYLMPSVYTTSVNKKVNPLATGYDPDIELVDYYDASDPLVYPNTITPNAPSYELHEFEDIKPELGTQTITGAYPINNDLTQADGWDDTMDGEGNYTQSYFKVQLPVLSFDLYASAAITQEMQLNMRSGACIGCTFPVQVDWDDYKLNFYDAEGNFAPDGEQRDLEKYPKSNEEAIEIIVQKEYQTFGTIMPNIYQKPSAGDEFVVLGISLPTSYITNAEQRLDEAMRSYMLANNVHYFDYPLKFDEKFLYEHTDILSQIRNNTVVRFEYAGQQLELYVKQITIKYGDSVLPQYDITLTDDVSVVLNQIGQVQADVNRLSSLLSTLRQSYGNDVWLELSKKLSRVADDIAQGKITFQKGLVSEKESNFKGDVVVGNATAPTQATTTPVVKSNQFVSGMQGWYLDHLGNMELESLTVRSYLEVMELLINRLQAQEGDTIFADNDQIESVEEETEGNTTTYLLTLKEKWDGYFTAQQEGNILKGVINTLAAKQSGGTDYSNGYTERFTIVLNPTGNPLYSGFYELNNGEYVLTPDETVVEGKAYYRLVSSQGIDSGGNLYYTSWMYVTNVYDNVPVLDEDGEPVLNGEGNPKTTRKIRVALWSDDQVPAQRNFPPCAKMNIARWGCMLDPTDDRYTTAQKQSIIKRQRLFYISTSDGRIMKLSHVNKPILEEWNYGTTLGTIPEFMWQWQEVAEKALPTRDYLYAQGIIYQSLIHVNPQGVPIGVFVDKGVWQNNTAYLHYAWNAETGQWETHDVWWMGCKWRCGVTQPVIEDGVSKYYEPTFNSNYWTLIEGNETFTLELTSSNGEQFQEGAVDTTITPRLYYGSNIEITAQIDSYNWSWSRRTSNTDGTSQADVTWNGLHSGANGVKNLAITDDDMPEEWSSSNKAIFTCRVGISKNNSVVYVEKDFFISHIISGRQGDPTPEYQLLYYGWSRYATTANQTISPSDIGEDDWTEFIPSAETGKPYLWLKTERWVWNKTYDANNRPVYILDNRQESPTPTYSRITGESGTGFQPKGSVANETALRALSGMAVGDAWMVENTGHLWVWSGTGWVDFGEIRGENGLSSYIHLAWAHAVATHSASAPNGAGVYPDEGMGFTTSKDAGQNFEYIGFLADNVVQDSQDPWKYTWKHMGGAVYVDLDNDNDTVLMNADGMIGDVISTGTLYVGGMPVTQGVTWSRTTSGVSIANSIINGVDYRTNVIKVLGMSADAGWVLLKATYNGVEYVAKLTLKRSESTKFEIIPDVNAIAYNTTTMEPEYGNISFKIKMTDITGGFSYLDMQDIDHYGFDLLAYGINEDLRDSLRIDENNYNFEFSGLNDDYQSYYIELSESGDLLDGEDIPVLRFKDGDNAVGLIITPPAIVVPCDSSTSSYEYQTDIVADLRWGDTQATNLSFSNISSPSEDIRVTSVNGKLRVQIDEGYDMSDITTGSVISFNVAGYADGVRISATGRVQVSTVCDGSAGPAGKDSVRLDLDNESDSMQYSSSGEQITSAVITRASLYDGNTLKTSGITWAYELNGIPAANETNGIVVGNFSSGVKPFTIREITQENATLTVKATYKSTTYRAIFSIKKLLNKDKYEIVVNPDAITFNPDEQSTPAQDLVVQINHWSPSGAYSQVDSTTTTGAGLKLYAAKVNASGTETLGNPVAISDGKYTIAKGLITTSLSAYRFILKDGIDGNILDSETVPIAQLHSGTSIYADLSNEMDAVPMDKDGNVSGSNTITTTFNLYYGTAPQTLTSLSPSKIGETSNPSKVTVTPVASTGLVTITITNGATFTNDKLTIRLVGGLTINGQQISKQLDFTIQGVRAGDDGKSPTIYQLNPSDSTIKKNKNATLSPSVVTCNIIKRVGNSAPVAMPASGTGNDGSCIVYFKRDIDNDWVQYSSDYVTNGISTEGTTTGIKFRLYSGNNNAGTLLDSETLPLVEDGKDGSGSNAVRLDLTNEMDSIQYSGTTKVGANAQTTARLYDGAQEVTSGVDYSIVPNSYEGCDSTTATGNGQVFTISGIASNATQARITIKAVHTKNNVSNTYYATFTVKKLVDQPKYELEVTPNSLAYNKDTNKFNTTPSIKIKVKKTDINGNVTYPTTLNSENLYLYMGGWRTTGSAGYTSLIATNALNISNYSYSNAENEIKAGTYSDYYIELRKTNSSGELLDHENIPVTTVENGDAGAAIKAEYSPTNTATSGHDEFQEGDIYMRTKIDKEGEDWSDWVRIVGESGGETDYKFNISNRATSTSASEAPPATTFFYRTGNTINWQDAPMATTNDYQYLWAMVQKKNGNGGNVGSAYYIRLTGEAGPAGTTYEIRSTMGEVVIGESADTATLNTTVSLYQSVGLNPATNLQAYFTWYRRIGSTFYKLGYSSQIGGTFQITVTSIRTSSADDIVVFARTSSAYTSTYAPTQSAPSDYLAKLEIPVRKQGGQGPTGPEGPSGKNAVRINIDNQADLISCYSDGKVRYARTVVTEVTIYDGAEYATKNVGVVTLSSSLAIGGCSVSRANITSNGVIVGYRFTWNFGTSHTISQAVSKDIVLSYNGVEYSTSFSLTPINSSAIYQLAPDPTSISFARASNGIDFASPTTVYVKLHARKIEGANSTLITTPTVGDAEGLSIMWKRVGVESSFTGSKVGASGDTGVDISANSNCTSLALQLYKDNILVDEEDISVMRAGKDGAGNNATSYRIVVVSSSASINASGQLVANITWRVKRNTGGTDYDVSLNSSNSFYKLNTDSSWTAISGSGTDVSTKSYNQPAGSPFPTSISLLYGTSSNPLATTEIPITIMGQMGRNFYYAGIWSANVEYTLTDFSAPFVILRETGQPDFYYVMQGENRTIKGNDHKPSNTNTDWHEMETSFKYLITEAMFTNFAKLGASIFNEDYMFSQYGYMVGYDGVREKIETNTQYQYADAGDMDAIGNITTIKGENKTNYHLTGASRQPLTDIELQSGRYYTVQVDATCRNGSNANNVKIDIKNRDTSNIIYSKTFTLQNAESKNLCFVFECTTNAWYNIVTTASAPTTNGLVDVQLSYISIGTSKFTPSLYINLRTGQMVANDLTARGMLYASSVGYSHITGTTNDEILYVGEESFVVLKDVFQSVNGQAKVVLPAPSDCKGRVIEVFGYAGSSQETFYMTWVGAASTAAFGWPWGGTGHAVNTQFTKTTTYIKLYSDGTIWRIMKQE